MKLSKSLKTVFSHLKKSAALQLSPQKETEEPYLHFPSGKELENKFSEEVTNSNLEEAEKNIQAFKDLQDNEKKWEFRAGSAELNGKPVRILDTRMLGKNTPRLRALVSDSDDKISIHEIHRLDKIKLNSFSAE